MTPRLSGIAVETIYNSTVWAPHHIDTDETAKVANDSEPYTCASWVIYGCVRMYDCNCLAMLQTVKTPDAQVSLSRDRSSAVGSYRPTGVIRRVFQTCDKFAHGDSDKEGRGHICALQARTLYYTLRILLKIIVQRRIVDQSGVECFVGETDFEGLGVTGLTEQISHVSISMRGVPCHLTSKVSVKVNDPHGFKVTVNVYLQLL